MVQGLMSSCHAGGAQHQSPAERVHARAGRRRAADLSPSAEPGRWPLPHHIKGPYFGTLIYIRPQRRTPALRAMPRANPTDPV